MIYVTGSLAYDFIMDYPGKFADQIVPEKIHAINLSFLVNNLKESLGGTAGNIAYNLSLWKKLSAVVGVLGKDGKTYLKFLKKHKINTKSIRIIPSVHCARAFITTDLSDNQITGFYPGALNFEKNLSLPDNVSAKDFVIISPSLPQGMKNYLDFCISRKLTFLFDPGMQLPRLTAGVLTRALQFARIIVGNDYENALLLKKIGLKKWILADKRQIIVTTFGEKGCLIQSGSGQNFIEAVKTDKIVDPTGAGDAFRAGFVSGFVSGLPLTVCGRMGNLTAVYAVENYGTSNHKFTLSQIKKRYRKNYGVDLLF